MEIGTKVYFTQDGLTAYGIVVGNPQYGYEDYDFVAQVTEVISPGDSGFTERDIGDLWGIDKVNIKEYPGHNAPIKTLQRLLAGMPVSSEDKHAAKAALDKLDKYKDSLRALKALDELFGEE
jgi:hypothetical protein